MPETSESNISEIFSGLEQVTNKIEGAGNFYGGRSQSPEKIERGFMHGFTIDFDDWDALKIYADNEQHRELGARIVESARDGKDGIIVLDIEV